MSIKDTKQKLLGANIILLLIFTAGLFFISCKKDYKQPQQFSSEKQTETIDAQEPNLPGIELTHPRSDERMNERRQMASIIKNRYGFSDIKVLEAMLNVPRHWFVPEGARAYAYSDTPLPIGYEQTISQPFIVAYMTSVLKLNEKSKVLEIGTGSGYQAAV